MKTNLVIKELRRTREEYQTSFQEADKVVRDNSVLHTIQALDQAIKICNVFIVLNRLLWEKGIL